MPGKYGYMYTLLFICKITYKSLSGKERTPMGGGVQGRGDTTGETSNVIVPLHVKLSPLLKLSLSWESWSRTFLSDGLSFPWARCS